MQQLSRVCLIADHDQRWIEYVCVFPECNSSRFVCSKCVKMGNHKHQQQDQSHVLDNKELYEVLQERLSKRQKQQDINIKKGAYLQTQPLKSIIQSIQNSLKNMMNMIEQLEKGYKHSDQQLDQLLLKLRNNGFNQFDDVSINILMNIDEKVGDINISLLNQSNILIQNAIRIKEWCNFQQQHNTLQQKIRDSKYKLITYDQVKGNELILIFSSAISNDFKYFVAGGIQKELKIWNYNDNTLIKSIQLDKFISKIKFTDDSIFLYVGMDRDLYQFDVNNNFKETYKSSIHSNSILNIFCITNTIILTSSDDKTIIKTDVILKQQLLLIKAHDDFIYGLDYNHNLDIITSSSDDNSIKIWNGNNGWLFLEKQNAHKNNSYINQVLFIINGNQLISLDNANTIFIWKINYETKQLEQLQQISDKNKIFNISLMLNQQFISLVCSEYIKIYSIKGEYIKKFKNDVKKCRMYNTIQPQSMKAIAIQGSDILYICNVELDLD